MDGLFVCQAVRRFSTRNVISIIARLSTSASTHVRESIAHRLRADLQQECRRCYMSSSMRRSWRETPVSAAECPFECKSEPRNRKQHASEWLQWMSTQRQAHCGAILHESAYAVGHLHAGGWQTTAAPAMPLQHSALAHCNLQSSYHCSPCSAPSPPPWAATGWWGPRCAHSSHMTALRRKGAVHLGGRSCCAVLREQTR